MLQNNTSGKAKNATILHKYGHILFAVISRHEPITLSIPPTFQGNLIKQRIIQQISRIITCRVAYHHLSLFRRLHKLKKTKKNHYLSYFIIKSSVILLTSQNKLCNRCPLATSIHDTLNQCWRDVIPSHATSAQLENSIGSTSRICCEATSMKQWGNDHTNSTSIIAITMPNKCF